MSSVARNKLLLGGIAAVVILWAACQLPLWFDVFDTSEQTGLVLLVAAFTAGVAGLAAAKGLGAVLGRLVRQRSEAAAALLAWALCDGPRPRRIGGRAQARLLAAATVQAIILAALSSALIPVARWAVRELLERFLFSPESWRIVQFSFVVVGFLPAAAGLGALYRTGARLWGTSGARAEAAYWRAWVWSFSAGAAAFAALWFSRIGLASTVVGCAILLLLIASRLWRRTALGGRVRARNSGDGRPRLRQVLPALAAYAVLSYFLLFQCRLWVELIGTSSRTTIWWVAGSLGLLAAFSRKTDGRPRPAGDVRVLGAVIAIGAGLLAQLGLGAAARRGGAGAALCMAGILAVQVPLAATAAVVFSALRRALMTELFTPALGAGVGLLGTAVGLGAAAAFGFAGGGRGVWALSLVGLIVLPAVAAARGAGRRERWPWIVYAAVLVFSLGGAVGWEFHFPCAAVPAGRERWKSPQIERAVRQILARYRGRWWFITDGESDISRSPVPGVWARHSPSRAADLLPVRARGDGCVPRTEFPLLSQLERRTTRFDGALVLARDLGDGGAWRICNRTTMEQLARRVHLGGPVVLRASATAGHTAAVLAVAEGFRSAVGSGFLAVDGRQGELDVLLAGPRSQVEPPGCLRGLPVAALGPVLRACDEPPPLGIEGPRPCECADVSGWELIRRVRGLGYSSQPASPKSGP